MMIPKINLNLNQILKDGVKLSLLLAAAGIAYIGIQKLGILSYTGLTASQVMKVAQEMNKRCKILSRVTGKDIFGNTFYRGIYLGGGACAGVHFNTTTQ